MTLVDNFSRKTWTYFLHAKSKAFDCFKNFCAMMTTETRRRVKALRTDRGGEFCSNEFIKFCEEKGIRRQLTASYRTKWCGQKEEQDRSQHGPKEFWPEAVVWSVHILNRSPTFSVRDMTPKEVWSGRKPSRLL